MLGLIISLVVVGLVAGAPARLAVPGKQDLSIGGTVVLGVVGSFVGGFLGYLLFHHNSQNGFIQRPASSARSSARSSCCWCGCGWATGRLAASRRPGRQPSASLL
jgi:uncharacterized membrane protein YeaQ/YmgE (transglycosylase-associated protein family)